MRVAWDIQRWRGVRRHAAIGWPDCCTCEYGNLPPACHPKRVSLRQEERTEEPRGKCCAAGAPDYTSSNPVALCQPALWRSWRCRLYSTTVLYTSPCRSRPFPQRQMVVALNDQRGIRTLASRALLLQAGDPRPSNHRGRLCHRRHLDAPDDEPDWKQILCSLGAMRWLAHVPAGPRILRLMLLHSVADIHPSYARGPCLVIFTADSQRQSIARFAKTLLSPSSPRCSRIKRIKEVSGLAKTEQ